MLALLLQVVLKYLKLVLEMMMNGILIIQQVSFTLLDQIYLTE